ncbi:LysR family transcriptional regulator [Mycolicibacterium stellerae]|uniref:LysR family transcriptional regulator n=1 Tax=Mycolicibacterium stellerae TaxID=2358193 RepID=UPI000F0B873A|nr:LysR family transcriptional regulator [Mycolicibacterium stellerae]
MAVHVRDLAYFVAVAEELSFTKAATKRLFVSQPALSKQIRKLEDLVGTDLFARGNRGITLTAAGEALLPRARRMIAEWDRAFREIRDAAATQQQTLTVGFHTRIGRGLIPGITAAMAERLPGWRLNFRQVSWGDPTVGLADGGVDVAVAWLPVPPGDGFAAKTIATEDRWVSLPLNHRLAGRSSVRFAEIQDEPFIALPASAGVMRDFWLATEQRVKPPRIAAEAATADETFEAVAAGAGVALLSAGNAEIYRRDDVVHVRVSDLPPCHLAVVRRAGDPRTAVRIVMDACCRCAADPLVH